MKKRVFVAFIFMMLLLVAGIVNAADVENKSLNFSIANNNVNNALEKDIQIPESLKSVVAVVFGIKEGSIDAADFIILVCLWVMLLLLIHEAVSIAPIFEKQYLSWSVAVIITLLIAITGAIRTMADFFFGIGGFIKILSEWTILKLVFTLILVGILFYGASYLLGLLRRKATIESEEEKGVQEGVEIGLAKRSRKRE